jgi:prepilin-type processing-associated H-X9-DG protein
MKSSKSRSAFTILELLVVIGIIAVLMGLLIPAVQKVRAAGQRVKCSNQMRQLGLGLIRHHDERGVLPMGVTPIPSKYDFPYLTWLTRILPYVEQDKLWQQAIEDYRQQRNPFRTTPHSGLATPVALFTCPSDGRGSGPFDTHKKRVVAVTDYIGVLGTEHGKTDGVLYRGSSTRFGDISDGTSHTLMVGERPAGGDFWFGWWYAGVGMESTGSPDSLLGVIERRTQVQFTDGCGPGPYQFENANLSDICAVFHFWSLHPGGGNFLMCDGSVHFLNYSAAKILPALATRAGGETVELAD